MEGDLLGLDFGQTTTSKQAQQGVQLTIPGAFQFQPDTWQPQPTAQHLVPPVVQPASPQSQIAPPAAHLPPPPAAQITPPATQPAPLQSSPVSDTSSSCLGPSTPAENTQKVSATGTVWNPSPTLDVPQDPVLKEIKEKFGGHWKMVRSDPYDEYLKAAGVGLFARKLAITGSPEQNIDIKGTSIHINFHSTFHDQIYVFKLEESVENLVERSRQSVFCTYKDGKLTLLMTPLEPGLNRTQEVQRYINSYGELVMIYTCGTATCRRYFARITDLVTPLNIVG